MQVLLSKEKHKPPPSPFHFLSPKLYHFLRSPLKLVTIGFGSLLTDLLLLLLPSKNTRRKKTRRGRAERRPRPLFLGLRNGIYHHQPREKATSLFHPPAGFL